MPKCNSNVHFGTRAYLFSPEEGSCYVFSTRNNCCEFLASDGVIFQSVLKPINYIFARDAINCSHFILVSEKYTFKKNDHIKIKEEIVLKQYLWVL